jgi:two-component system chemotaxis response regulator CheB
MSKIKVMLIDDSAVVRTVNRSILEKEADIEVIGAAVDPLFALQRMQVKWPDAIVLDIEMPRMDGITFLKKIMAEHPTPTVICSSLAQRGAQMTMEALAAGAVAIIAKPTMGVKQFLQETSEDLVSAVRAAARANMKRLRNLPPPPKLTADAVVAAQHAGTRAMQTTTDQVIAIGTSTGGTQALEFVLTRVPVGCAGIVVVQHMPEKFTALFAERLNSLCSIKVKEAQNGDRVLPGSALIAPGGRHMLLERSGAQYHVEVVDGPVVNRHRPSVDVLFRSVAQVAGRNALGIIMTGMGDDGARGLKEMRDAGALTVAEDESTCVVYGMPKAAVALGGVSKVLPLDSIPGEIIASAR